ncbi:GNAT family N-acetyltransferase [Streptomyces liangshanensis]|uniref:GNAT family N-acetyltransferase n=1 Tax=Streptomyces liangshanensis TaxID=2717324 RepID=A0A6G9GWG9_9ACTN|nr:GNAT family N-acetyltransferase [Streptomyces liangshanensis]QIQ02608.1 GNAT family N-acetyltransferase [Streptomyces liangshanensis]
MNSDLTWSVRPLGAADVDAAVELLNLTSPSDVRHLLRADLGVLAAARDAPGRALVAERDGRLVGAAKVSEDLVFLGTAATRIAVDPAERGRGIGTALADRLMEDPLVTGRDGAAAGTVTSSLRDDLPRGRAFAERYGFGVLHHSVGFRFDLTGHEAELAQRAGSALERAGVRVRLADPSTEQEAIVECAERCRPGIPLPYGERPVDPYAWLADCPPGTVFLLAEPIQAEHGPAAGADVTTGTVRADAITVLTPLTDTNRWHVAFTATDPVRRGRGVAAAVKAASLLYACRAGVETVTTHNDVTNEPILRANRTLGMVPHVGYWTLTRPTGASATAPEAF